MRYILALSDLLNRLVIQVTTVLLAILLIINLQGIFFRYVLNDPLPWPLPISRILLVWIALLGVSVALKAGEHVAVEGLIRCLSRAWERRIRVLGFAIVGLWLAVILWQGWLAAVRANQLMMISADLQLPFTWRLAAVPVSAAVQLIHVMACPAIIEQAMQDRGEEAA